MRGMAEAWTKFLSSPAIVQAAEEISEPFDADIFMQRRERCPREIKHVFSAARIGRTTGTINFRSCERNGNNAAYSDEHRL
jgi:hypothetical protein